MRIFFILLSFIVLSSTEAKSQAKSPVSDPEPKIIKFYPNPAVSYITFEIAKESSKTYTLLIFNFLGKKVKEVPDIASKSAINVSDLVRGIYIFQLKEQTGRVTDSGTFQINK